MAMIRSAFHFAGAVFSVLLMLGLAFAGLVALPFYSAWTWFIGDPWWKEPKDRPAKGFWNTPK